MRTTIFQLVDGRVRPASETDHQFRELREFDGSPAERVAIHELETLGAVELQLVQILVGGHFPIHSSDKLAFCQVVAGAGRLGLPDGAFLDYRAPETYVFHPGTLHEWRDIMEDTVLSVALIPTLEGEPA